jgi:hypothetical protein
MLTRARLFVLLFDCVEHYLRVGGASFVRRAVVELLDGAAEIDDDRDESLLHLFADLLGASIVVVRASDANEPMLFRPTEMVNAERFVVFRQHPADGTWCVGVRAMAITDTASVTLSTRRSIDTRHGKIILVAAASFYVNYSYRNLSTHGASPNSHARVNASLVRAVTSYAFGTAPVRTQCTALTTTKTPLLCASSCCCDGIFSITPRQRLPNAAAQNERILSDTEPSSES